jgi:hypothetical protein
MYLHTPSPPEVLLNWRVPVCRSFKVQGSVLFLGTNAAAIAAAKAADKYNKMLWSLSSGLLFAIFQYTMLAHMPTTKRILRQVGACETTCGLAIRVWHCVAASH